MGQPAQPLVAFLEGDDSLVVLFVEVYFHGVVHVCSLSEDLHPELVNLQLVGLALADRTAPPLDVGVLLGDGPGLQAETVDVFAFRATYGSGNQFHRNWVFDALSAHLVHELNIRVGFVQQFDSFLTLQERGLRFRTFPQHFDELRGITLLSEVDHHNLLLGVVVDIDLEVVAADLDELGQVEGEVLAFAGRGVFGRLCKSLDDLAVDLDHALLGLVQFHVGAHLEHAQLHVELFFLLEALLRVGIHDECLLAGVFEGAQQGLHWRVERVDLLEVAVYTQFFFLREFGVVVVLETCIMDFALTVVAI